LKSKIISIEHLQIEQDALTAAVRKLTSNDKGENRMGEKYEQKKVKQMDVEEAILLLNLVIKEFFVHGEMPMQFAFARVVIASELLTEATSFESNKQLVNQFTKNLNCEVVCFPEDLAIDSHINNLLDLKKGLIGSKEGIRNTIMFIGNDD